MAKASASSFSITTEDSLSNLIHSRIDTQQTGRNQTVAGLRKLSTDNILYFYPAKHMGGVHEIGYVPNVFTGR